MSLWGHFLGPPHDGKCYFCQGSGVGAEVFSGFWLDCRNEWKLIKVPTKIGKHGCVCGTVSSLTLYLPQASFPGPGDEDNDEDFLCPWEPVMLNRK